MGFSYQVSCVLLRFHCASFIFNHSCMHWLRYFRRTVLPANIDFFYLLFERTAGHTSVCWPVTIIWTKSQHNREAKIEVAEKNPKQYDIRCELSSREFVLHLPPLEERAAPSTLSIITQIESSAEPRSIGWQLCGFLKNVRQINRRGHLHPATSPFFFYCNFSSVSNFHFHCKRRTKTQCV